MKRATRSRSSQPHPPGVWLCLGGELVQLPQLRRDIRQRDRLQRAATTELLVVHSKRPLRGLARAGQLIEKASAMEVLDRRNPARVGVGAQVAPIDELRKRIGDRLGLDVSVHLRADQSLVEILDTQMHHEPPLRGDELRHEVPVQRDVGCREMGEWFERIRFHTRDVSPRKGLVRARRPDPDAS